MSQLTVIESCDSSQKSFYLEYVALCKEKNVPAILDLIKHKNKLELMADKIKIDQWLMIFKSLDRDNSLEVIAIRSRKSTPFVDENIDSAKKCSHCDVTAIISTKFIFAPLIKTLSECIKRNFIVTSLSLEGLPLTTNYIQSIANAISQNNSLKTISFARSPIKDDGCNVICSIVKHLPHIEKINFTQCCLTVTAAIQISELIKFQTINRCSEGWKQSLRYRYVDVDTVPGLKCLVLNGNVFGDVGLELIASNLKEDLWIKAIEVQNCEITDMGGLAILDCLKVNKTLVVFDASYNYKISSNVFKQVQMMLGTEPDDYDTPHKTTLSELREKIEFLEQCLQLKIFNRKHADDVNDQINKELAKYDDKIQENSNEQTFEVPIGYKLVNEDILNSMFQEIDELLLERPNDKRDEYDVIKKDIHDNIEQFGFGDIPSARSHESSINSTLEDRDVLTSELQESSINSKPVDRDILTSDDEIFCNPKLIWSKSKTTYKVETVDEFDQQICANEERYETEDSDRSFNFDRYNAGIKYKY